MENITVIIPIYEDYEKIKNRLSIAINSAIETSHGKSSILVIGPKKSFGKILEKKGIEFLENNEETDFCNQINKAVNECKTKYFSVLEYDDIYTPIWFDNVIKYMDTLKDVQYFLPLTEAYLEKNKEGGAIGYINEPVWASSFSNELGYIDLDSLTIYPEFNMTGAIIEKEAFIADGGLKPSIKISFWYEFMMRTAYLGRKLYVIPKVGYNHFLERPGSLAEQYHETISQEEADWWIALAQQEYFFKKDRKKEYVKE